MAEGKSAARGGKAESPTKIVLVAEMEMEVRRLEFDHQVARRACRSGYVVPSRANQRKLKSLSPISGLTLRQHHQASE